MAWRGSGEASVVFPRCWGTPVFSLPEGDGNFEQSPFWAFLHEWWLWLWVLITQYCIYVYACKYSCLQWPWTQLTYAPKTETHELYGGNKCAHEFMISISCTLPWGLLSFPPSFPTNPLIFKPSSSLMRLKPFWSVILFSWWDSSSPAQQWPDRQRGQFKYQIPLFTHDKWNEMLIGLPEQIIIRNMKKV